jgi:hypothetical protein
MSYVDNKLYRQFGGHRYMAIIDIANIAVTEGFQHRLNLARLPGMSSDYSDLGFSTLLGDKCSFWVESSPTYYIQPVWINPISGLHNRLLMFFGKSMISESDGEGTFDLFDHFLKVDSSKWTTISGTPSISGGTIVALIRAGGVSEEIDSIASFGLNYAVRGRVGAVHHQSTTYYEVFRFFNVWTRHANIMLSWSNSTYGQKYVSQGDNLTPAATTAISGYTAGTFCVWDIVRNGTTNIKYYKDDSLQATHAGYDSGNWYVSLAAANADGATIAADWVAVRKCASTEPTCTISWWGKNPYYHKSMCGGIS